MTGIRSKSEFKNWLFRSLLSVAAGILICSAPALSTEREARFVYSPSGTANLAHWNKRIVLDVAGDVSSHWIIEATSQVAFWAKIARTEIAFTLPIAGSTPDTSDDVTVNYFVFFDNTFDTGRKTTPKNVSQATIDRFSGDLKMLLNGELLTISNGCQIGRRAEDDNETLAFIAVIDQTLGREDRESCLEVAVISSFGLIPNIYSREYTVGSEGREISVSDYSEPITLLAASAACVKDAEEFNPRCAAAIAGAILGIKIH